MVFRLFIYIIIQSDKVIQMYTMGIASWYNSTHSAYASIDTATEYIIDAHQLNICVFIHLLWYLTVYLYTKTFHDCSSMCSVQCGSNTIYLLRTAYRVRCDVYVFCHTVRYAYMNFGSCHNARFIIAAVIAMHPNNVSNLNISLQQHIRSISNFKYSLSICFPKFLNA